MRQLLECGSLLPLFHFVSFGLFGGRNLFWPVDQRVGLSDFARYMCYD